MKKFIILTIAISLLLGCSKSFLDTPPISQLSTDSFYKTQEDAKQATLAVYSVLQGPRFYGHSYYALTEMASDDVTTKLSADPIDDFNWSPIRGQGGTEFLENIWFQIYEGIYRANLVINSVPGISMDETLKKTNIAEAKFLRGVFYWHLAVVFGNGPIFFAPATSIKTSVGPTEPREKVLAQAESDLLASIKDLPDSWESGDKGRATKYSAIAFLGKLYLHWACYDKANANALFNKAKEQFKLIYEQKGTRFDLLKDFNLVFSKDYDNNTAVNNENNKESIFEIQYADRGAAYSGWFSDGGIAGEGTQRDLRWGIQNQTAQNGYQEFISTQDWVYNLEIGDPRARASVYFLWDSSLTGYEGGTAKYPKKLLYSKSMASKVKDAANIIQAYFHVKKAVNGYTGAGSIMNSPKNWPMIRFSDVLLMYAEAINETEGPTELAMSLLNQVRKRAKDMTGLSYGFKNSYSLTSVATPTIAGSTFLNPFPYYGSNEYGDEFDFTDGSYESLRRAIVLERRAELAFEYHRFLDMRRWESLDKNHPGAAELVFKSKYAIADQKSYVPAVHSLYPIPGYEVDNSDNKLKQNPGY